jgi:hypothetical protein
MLSADDIVRRHERVQSLHPKLRRSSLVDGKKLAKTPLRPVRGPDRHL